MHISIQFHLILANIFLKKDLKSSHVPELTCGVQKKKKMRTNLPVTFIVKPNGSHSLWTNCVGKPRQACDRWSEWTGGCWQCEPRSGKRFEHNDTERDTEKNLKLLLCLIRHKHKPTLTVDGGSLRHAHTYLHTGAKKKNPTMVSKEDEARSSP